MVQGKNLPEVIIVKKTYPKYRKKQKQRQWKLKHLDKEYEENVGEDEFGNEQIKQEGKKSGKKGKKSQIT